MTKSMIRWGLISTANINKKVIPAIQSSKNGQLTAVSSRDSQKAKDYALKWDIPHSFESYQAMLDSGKIDAVYISLPNHLHAEWSIKAMNTGIHVLCEKPFALTLQDVDQMIAVHKGTGVKLAEAFMYRHHPQTKLISDWVKSGKLGEVSLVRGTFDFAFRSANNIRLNPDYGGGSLWDVGVYPISFAQLVMGTVPDWVMGSQWVGETGVDEVFSGLLKYPGERTAMISSSFRTPWHTFFEIVGTEGRIYLSRPFVEMDDNHLPVFSPSNGKHYPIKYPQEYLYSGQIEDMHSAILDNHNNLIDLVETRNHILTTLALKQSATETYPIFLQEFVNG